MTHKKSNKLTMSKQPKKILKKCQFCPYSTKENDRMKKHMIIHIKLLKQSQTHIAAKATCKQPVKSPVMRKYLQKGVIKCQFSPYLTRESKSMKTSSKEKLFNKLSASMNSRCTQCTQNKNKKIMCYVCQKCSYTTTSVLSLRKHKAIHMKKNSFSCSLCSYKALHLLYLKMHMIGEHTQESSHKCSHCGYKSSSINRLKEHMMIHTGFKPFACLLCSYRSRKMGGVKRHMKIHYNKTPRNNSSKKQNSRTSDQISPARSDRCKSKNTAKAKTKQIIQEQCPNENCENIKTVEEKLLIKRIQSSKYPKVSLERLNVSRGEVRLLVKQPKCDQIQSGVRKGKRTRVRSSYISKKRRCLECSYSTSYFSTMKRHIMSRHTGERPYPCSSCSYRTISSFNLKKHERTHTKNKSLTQQKRERTYTKNKSISYRIRSYKMTQECVYTKRKSRHNRRSQEALSTETSQKDPPLSSDLIKIRKKDPLVTQKKIPNDTSMVPKPKPLPPKFPERNVFSSPVSDIWVFEEPLVSIGSNATSDLHQRENHSPCLRLSGDALGLKDLPKLDGEGKEGQPAPREKFHECSLCPFKTTFLLDINQHMMEHTGERPFACPFCPYKARRSGSIESHLMVHEERMPHRHNSQITENCSFALRSQGKEHSQLPSVLQKVKGGSAVQRLGASAKKIKSSLEEEASVTKLAFPSEGNKRQKEPQNSVKHKETSTSSTASSKRTYIANKRCPKCVYTSAHVSTLKRHIMSKHTGERPWKCEFCSYETVSSFNLKKHTEIHFRERQLNCDLCPYKGGQINLKRHMLRIHNESMKYNLVKQTHTHILQKEYKMPFRQAHLEERESWTNSNFFHGAVNVEVSVEENETFSPSFVGIDSNDGEANSFENLSIKQEKAIKMEIEDEFLEDPNEYSFFENDSIGLDGLAYTPPSTSDDMFFQDGPHSS